MRLVLIPGAVELRRECRPTLGAFALGGWAFFPFFGEVTMMLLHGKYFHHSFRMKFRANPGGFPLPVAPVPDDPVVPEPDPVVPDTDPE